MGIIVYVSNKPFVSDFNALQLQGQRPYTPDELPQLDCWRYVIANDVAAAVTNNFATATTDFGVNPGLPGVNTDDDTDPLPDVHRLERPVSSPKNRLQRAIVFNSNFHQAFGSIDRPRHTAVPTGTADACAADDRIPTVQFRLSGCAKLQQFLATGNKVTIRVHSGRPP